MNGCKGSRTMSAFGRLFAGRFFVKALFVSLAIGLGVAVPVEAENLPFNMHCRDGEAEGTFGSGGRFTVKDLQTGERISGTYELHESPQIGGTHSMTFYGNGPNGTTSGALIWAQSGQMMIDIGGGFVLDCGYSR